MKNPWVITGAILALVIGGSILVSNSAAERNNEGVEFVKHIKGKVDSAITLVEYSDFECPACASFQPAIEGVMAEFGEDISFEYKHFPLPMHKHAQSAARAAEAAGQQGMFFEFHDLLFADQSAWAQSPAPNTFFFEYAEELGLDIELFKQHLNSTVLRDRIRADSDESRDLGLTGTPTFFLNGEKMQFDTYESFVAQIAAAVDPTSASSSDTSSPEVRFGI